jgi:sulfur-oxidizing protein SoxX
MLVTNAPPTTSTGRHTMRAGLTLPALALLAAATAALAQTAPYEVVKDGIPKPLTSTPGSAARGKALLLKKEQANCLTCHSSKDLKGGNSGPSFDGVGAALTPPQLRLSVVDYSKVAAGKAMPSFHKARGDEPPRLTAQEVEDIVAYLSTLH